MRKKANTAQSWPAVSGQVFSSSVREGGNLALKAVAGCLTKNTRQSDVVARYAEEEFVILLPHTSLSNARLAAEKICKAIADIEVNGSNGSAKGTFQLSASLGVAFLNPTEREQALESMLRRVDQALNRVKIEGRNCVRG